MLNRLVAVIFTILAATSAQSQGAHICWVDRVEREGSGVRVFFTNGAPVRSGEDSVHAELGGILTPANSGHDGCSITVAQRGNELGVEAKAFFFAPGLMKKPDERSEWISVKPAP